MRTALKFSISLVLLLLLSAVIYLNQAVYYTPSIKVLEGNTVNMDVLRQLRHLKHEMKDGAANDMQRLYPEGYIFMHALYGLGWCDFVREHAPASPLYIEALEEINMSARLFNHQKHVQSSMNI
jgi:hypothetical protein